MCGDGYIHALTPDNKRRSILQSRRRSAPIVVASHFLKELTPCQKNILTLTRGSVARRFYEADNLMQEWKRDGDKRYAIYIDTLSKVVQAFERD